MGLFCSEKFVEMNGVRFRPDQIVGYHHHYMPPSPDQDESYVEVLMEGGSCFKIHPKEDGMKSEQVMAMLDSFCGMPAKKAKKK